MFELQIVYLGVFMGLISCMAINSKYPYIDIDDMLRRVIKSEKFDEIAEKIADKAVERLSALKNSESLIKIREGALAYPVSRVSETNTTDNQTEKQTEIKSPTTTEVDNKSEETTKKTIELITDTTKKKSTKSSKDLSLKFKRFTRLNYLKDDDKETGNKDDANEIKRSQEITLESNATRTTAKEDNKTERTKTKKSKRKEKSKEKEKDKEANNSDSTEEKSTEKTTKAVKEESSEPESAEPDSLNKDYEADRKLQLDDEPEKVGERRPSEFYKLRAPKYSDESNNTENEGGVWGSEEHSKSTKEKKSKTTKLPRSKNKKSKKKDKKNTTLKDIIRREGNKLYTYEKSPDYAEYHEEIARIQKKMNNDDEEFNLK